MAIVIKHLKEEFVDERGGIARIIDEDNFSYKTVLRITSKKGSVRSNHYHKRDAHYLYVEQGVCEYFEKPADQPKAKVQTVLLKAGDLVLTKPGIIHAVKALEDSILYALTTETRKQKKYEEDTVRVVIVK